MPVLLALGYRADRPPSRRTTTYELAMESMHTVTARMSASS